MVGRAGSSMAELSLNVAADVGDAVAALNTLQSRLSDLSSHALDAARRMQQMDAAYLTAFKNSMQVMVDTKQLTLQQALGFDIDYSAQLFQQEQLRLGRIRDSEEQALGIR